MRLVVMRHGSAAKAGAWSDADRPLTLEGEADLECIARGLARLEVRPQLVLASPALRCLRSAEIVAAGLGMPPTTVRALEALAVGGSPGRLLSDLAGFGLHEEEVLLVGHQPDLLTLGSILLAGDTVVSLQWRCGSCARFEVDALPPTRPATLHWFLTPMQLRLLAAPAPA
jgi:phosphohistidine phosphatase